MNKLSYVCTMGPSMANLELLEKMYFLGMTTIRFNMSYNHPKIYELLKIAKELKVIHPDVEILFDSAGPEIRIKVAKELEFQKNDELIIGKDFEVSLNNLYLLEKDDLIYIKDGDYVFLVLGNDNSGVRCKALTNGIIKNNYKLYNERLYNNLPFMSDYDKEIIKIAVENNIDSFAISFVRNKDNIKLVRDTFEKYGKENIKIIAKIENKEALNNLEEIIVESDEVMVARGDLSTILPRVNIGYYQKLICRECQTKNKPIMIATGIMSSMEQNDDPKISEILDLYNIILDGVEKVVFTGETSVAHDPLDVLQTANDIFETTKINF